MDKFAADLLHSQNSLEQSMLKIAADQERQGHLLQALVAGQQSKRLETVQMRFLNSDPNSVPPQRGGDPVSHTLYCLFVCLLNCLLFTLILRAFPSLQLLLL